MIFEHSSEQDQLAEGLNAAQKAMGSAVKDADNPFFKSKYADLGSVVRAIKDPFADNGLSYTQFPICDGETAGVITVLMHKSGQWMRSSYTIPLVKRDAQAVGSCITYARRYALQAIAGIPADDEDGNKASEPLDPLAVHNDAVKRNCVSITAVKLAIEDQKWEEAAEAYMELTNDDKHALWLAPSKGGVWTTAERAALKSDDFNAARKAMYGA